MDYGDRLTPPMCVHCFTPSPHMYECFGCSESICAKCVPFNVTAYPCPKKSKPAFVPLADRIDVALAALKKPAIAGLSSTDPKRRQGLPYDSAASWSQLLNPLQKR